MRSREPYAGFVALLIIALIIVAAMLPAIGTDRTGDCVPVSALIQQISTTS